MGRHGNTAYPSYSDKHGVAPPKCQWAIERGRRRAMRKMGFASANLHFRPQSSCDAADWALVGVKREEGVVGSERPPVQDSLVLVNAASAIPNGCVCFAAAVSSA